MASRGTSAKLIGPTLLVLLSPLILLWIIVAIPFSLIKGGMVRWREKRFAARMRAADRLVSWAEARSQIDVQRGTLIDESVPGDVSRLWWTPVDVPTLSPHPYCPEGDKPPEPWQHINFDEWCRSQFTNPETGSAKLIDLHRADRDELWDHLVKDGKHYGGDGEHYVRVRWSASTSSALRCGG